MDVSIEVSLTVECEKCGADLDFEIDRSNTVKVEVCTDCIEQAEVAAKKEGDDEGYERAQTEAAESAKEKELTP